MEVRWWRQDWTGCLSEHRTLPLTKSCWRSSNSSSEPYIYSGIKFDYIKLLRTWNYLHRESQHWLQWHPHSGLTRPCCWLPLSGGSPPTVPSTRFSTSQQIWMANRTKQRTRKCVVSSWLIPGSDVNWNCTRSRCIQYKSILLSSLLKPKSNIGLFYYLDTDWSRACSVYQYFMSIINSWKPDKRLPASFRKVSSINDKKRVTCVSIEVGRSTL